jgi:hypothetical protein
MTEEPAAASGLTMASSQSSEALWSSSHSNDTRSVNQASALMTSALEESSETENLSDYEEFCVIDEPGLGISVNIVKSDCEVCCVIDESGLGMSVIIVKFATSLNNSSFINLNETTSTCYNLWNVLQFTFILMK